MIGDITGEDGTLTFPSSVEGDVDISGRGLRHFIGQRVENVRPPIVEERSRHRPAGSKQRMELKESIILSSFSSSSSSPPSSFLLLLLLLLFLLLVSILAEAGKQEKEKEHLISVPSFLTCNDIKVPINRIACLCDKTPLTRTFISNNWGV